ncbi:hypothetical protein [Microbulbifer thermotolerans]|uniref:hypothetical protein n=1 Tax=Microbulbifer thermotolerans TaxID=252514 RepID=UPI00224AEEF6|nr:hypothetical protein [Microbulbifer thermotolerans]MCX2781043.1 hypothetical protein [Microbulbifer thermotolerans]MCX2806360.1 hypothetical protein [Microbulbifer thermotolerans]
MKKVFAVILLVLFSSSVSAEDWITHNDKIEELDIWPSGSDEWGIKFKPSQSPHVNCPDGFYIEHDSNNKQIAYSTLLTAFSLDLNVKVQFKPSQYINGSCRANRITVER